MNQEITIHATDNREIAGCVVGQLAIQAFPQSWINSLWREYCELTAAVVASSGPITGTLLYSLAQGPTAVQRRIMTDEYGIRLQLMRLRRNVVLTTRRSVLWGLQRPSCGWCLVNVNF